MAQAMTSGTNTRTTRRTFRGTTGAAALLTAARAACPSGAYAAGSGPEAKAVLGFIALTDASPLVIAKEKGLFAEHGMQDVEVVKQAFWGRCATAPPWARPPAASTAPTS
jgi:nitrate/nitrite transport system substrate-binding protein